MRLAIEIEIAGLLFRGLAASDAAEMSKSGHDNSDKIEMTGFHPSNSPIPLRSFI
ncbi:MAG: hypothetical protein ACP5SH_05090 [Syntrophobacteraceae bacterium]